ncbi:MAG: hypothetical protein U0Q11_03440 [Vicinamibacterales bacterium]
MSRTITIGRLCLAVVLTAACRVASATAQGLPSEPFVVGDGRVVISGDVALTASCSHATGAAACTADTGFFNFTDYDSSTIRTARAGLSTAVRLTRQVSVLGDFRTEYERTPWVYSLYVRVKPFGNRDIDVQAGRIPSVFGSFSRHAYSADNPLIGYPLAYQYLTSLRPDALPADPDDLIRMRGRGWLSSFPLGDQTPRAGLPLANALQMDTGVEVHGATSWLELAASVTNGSLSNPLVRDTNTGKQIAGRAAFKPVTGLVAGVSVSRAPYVTSTAANAAFASTNRFVQRAIGADVEYSRDHYLLRLETVSSEYRLSTIAPTLRAMGTAVEGRYKLTPRLYAAARFDHLGFNTVSGAARTATWEAPVTRWETGAGYALQHNTHVRMSFQHNRRDGGRVREMIAVSGQILYWF